jgi:hypothetical protein
MHPMMKYQMVKERLDELDRMASEPRRPRLPKPPRRGHWMRHMPRFEQFWPRTAK